MSENPNKSAPQVALVANMDAWLARVPDRSIPKLAEAAELDPSYLRKVIAFKTSISLPRLDAVARAMGMTAAEALKNDDRPPVNGLHFAVRCLSEHLIETNDTVKDTASSLLSRLALYPEKADEVAKALWNLLRAEDSEPLTAVRNERKEKWDSGSLEKTIQIDTPPPESLPTLPAKRSRKGG